jgi:hypothetical protein
MTIIMFQLSRFQFVEDPVVCLVFKDTYHITNLMELLPRWNDLFLKFKDEDYLGTIPHSDLMVREVDDR